MFYEIIYTIKKFSYVGFRSKFRPPECTRIANSEENLLCNVVDKFIDYCSNELKKLQDVFQSTNKRPSDLKKYPLKTSIEKIPENHLILGLLRQVPPLNHQY